MNGMIFRSFRKRNSCQKNTNTVYSEKNLFRNSPKRRRPDGHSIKQALLYFPTAYNNHISGIEEHKELFDKYTKRLQVVREIKERQSIEFQGRAVMNIQLVLLLLTVSIILHRIPTYSFAEARSPFV